jgi:hypothetical protein
LRAGSLNPMTLSRIVFCVQRRKIETDERDAKREKQKRKRELEREEDEGVVNKGAYGKQASEVVEEVEKLSSDADIKLTRKEHKRMSEVLASSLNSARRSSSPEGTVRIRIDFVGSRGRGEEEERKRGNEGGKRGGWIDGWMGEWMERWKDR